MEKNPSDIWDEAITAFEKRLTTFYDNQRGSTIPVIVSYHVKQIANDLRKEYSNEIQQDIQ